VKFGEYYFGTPKLESSFQFWLRMINCFFHVIIMQPQ